MSYRMTQDRLTILDRAVAYYMTMLESNEEGLPEKEAERMVEELDIAWSIVLKKWGRIGEGGA